MKFYDNSRIYTIIRYYKHLFFIFFLLCSMTANAQNQSVTLSGKLTLREAFVEIEKQTDFSVDYNNQLINADVPIKKGYKNARLSDVLNELLGEVNCSYVIQGTHILITLKNGLLADERIVTGTIKDSYGDPVIGASVVERGTQNGVISDINGNFNIKINEDGVLLISYIGYEGQTITTTNKNSFNIVLKEDSELLEEVVVIGYGTMRKKDLTGAISHVDAEKLANERPATVQDILRGAAPGLLIDGPTLNSNGEVNMLVRGSRSLKAGNGPLFVLNGVIFNGDLSEINPVDIESVDILKDASSAAIYGAKSANGVVIITTKKGSGEKPTIKFDGSIGFVTRGNNREVYSPEGYLQYRSDYATSSNGFENEGYYRKPTAENLSKYGLTEQQWRSYDAIGQSSHSLEEVWVQRLGLSETEQKNYFAGNTYDWYDASFQSGLQQSYNISLSGQTPRVNYYWSLGYQDNKGIVVGDKFTNYRTNLRLDAKATDFLEAGVNLFLQTRDEGAQSVNWGGQLGNTPYSTPYYEDGSLNPWPMGETNQVKGINSKYDIAMSSKSAGTQNVTANFYTRLKLPFNISYQFSFAPRYSWKQDRSWNSSQSVHDSSNGSAARSTARSIVWTLDNMIKWNYTFAQKHNFDVTLLQSAEQFLYWGESMEGSRFSPSDVLEWHNMGIAAEKKISSNDSKYTGDAMMARLIYNYDDRYFLTASVRRDGYSAFGRSNPRATFPALAFAWNFTNEKFFSWEPMSNGKLRFSWGKNGNRDIGIYQAMSQLYGGLGGKYSFLTQTGTLYEMGSLQIERMSNNDLKWESTASWNVGFDFGFLNNRINGTFEWYYMPTTDLLMDRSLPNVSGFSQVVTNLGEVLNQGFEFSLNTSNIVHKNFTWSTTFGLTHNQNRIKHLYFTYEDVLDAEGNIIGSKEVDDKGRNWYIGKPIDAIYGYEFIGIWQEGEEEEAAKYGQRPGDAKARDVNEDYRIGDEDKVFLGNQSPKFRWNLRNDFTLFKNWDISINMYAHTGREWGTTDYLNYFDHSGDYMNTFVRGYWTPENKSNEYARLKSTRPSNIDPLKIIKRDMIRLENISIGYQVPKKYAAKIFAQDIRVYGTVRNVAVIALDRSWKFWDPETGSIVPRTFTLGANITF